MNIIDIISNTKNEVITIKNNANSNPMQLK